MRTSALALVLGVAGIGTGCGGSAASLDCNYLASDNCWKTTASAATICLPASSEVGTLSADGKTCTYASGDVVTFAQPLVLPLSGPMDWDFTVTTARGAQCLAYLDEGGGIRTLTVQGQTVKETTPETAPGQLGIALTCPDGTTYSISNGFNLLGCPDAGLSGSLPGYSLSSTDTVVTLSLIGTAASSNAGEVVLNCQTAQ